MKACVLGILFLVRGVGFGQPINVPWYGYGKDAQHTATAANASQPLHTIHWSTPVDLNKPQGELFIHYASPMVTAANTVFVPVKLWQNGTDGFKIQAFAAGVRGTSPAPLYELSSDYVLPPHNWTPAFPASLSLRNRLYYAGSGGTVYYRDQVDSATGPAGRIAFFGNAEYSTNSAAYNSTVQISTPLVNDRYGDIYFGFTVTGDNPLHLASGVARISANGAGSWVSAQSAAGDPTMTLVAMNSAPVLSTDQRVVYFVATDGAGGYLVSVNSTSLAPMSRVKLFDPSTGNPATVSADSSAAPIVGPDGDVYFGVLETPCCSSHNDRGWLLHFNSTLTQTKTPGSFGWDTTPSVVPKNSVPSYGGHSSYLLVMKYNNYAGIGSGDGRNRVAMLDPNAIMPDPIQPSVNVMKEVMTVLGVTPEGAPPAVKEWCINSAAIDPFTKSAIVNSEDGNVYRWDFVSGNLTQSVNLNPPIGEAYTPTVIGPDGTVFAINDGILYGIGN